MRAQELGGFSNGSPGAGLWSRMVKGVCSQGGFQGYRSSRDVRDVWSSSTLTSLTNVQASVESESLISHLTVDGQLKQSGDGRDS